MLLIQRPEIKAHGEESGNKQSFLIAPLEPGFGHTLGNSLRRTLLSSIPGAALLRIIEVIGPDKIVNIDEDTVYFIINTLNQLNVDLIRNKLLLKVLPLKV